MTKFNDVKTSIAKQSHIKELILTTIGCHFFFGLSLYFTNNDALSWGFVLVAYICSIAFFIFADLSKQKNGCLLTILGLVPALLALIFFPISIPIILIFSNKIKNYQKEKEEKISKIESELDKILEKCKQDGSLDDIKQLKVLVEKNINNNGSDIEFLELNFAIAKIYNNLKKIEEAKEYFTKVKSIVLNLDYEDLCSVAKNSTEKNDFYNAVFYYSYILLYNKVSDNKEIPDVYYNRALAYLGINQVFYQNKAIEDIKTAIAKVKEISDTLSYLEIESFLEGKLDKYNIKIGEIYQSIKEYSEAIVYYNKIEKYKCNTCGKKYSYKAEYCSCGNNDFSNLENEYVAFSQNKIQECQENNKKIKAEIKAEMFYQKAMEDYNNGIYYSAKANIEHALSYCKDSKYINFLKEIDNSMEKEEKKKLLEEKEVVQAKEDNNKKTKLLSKSKKIKIESCSKVDLLSIDGFDEEKADKFISERNKGKVYYDIESFVADYGLMPHQMVEIQDRLVFPHKPKNKAGRKVDF